MKSDLIFCFMSRMVLDRICGLNELEDPEVRDAISTLDDIAKEASENEEEVKLETRESVQDLLGIRLDSLPYLWRCTKRSDHQLIFQI